MGGLLVTAGQPLRGFVGQSLAARKMRAISLIGLVNSSQPPASSGTISATHSCWAFVYVGGGSAGGNDVSGAGGGGGGAAFKKLRLSAGQTLSWTRGAAGAAGSGTAGGDGGDSVVTLPNGLAVSG